MREPSHWQRMEAARRRHVGDARYRMTAERLERRGIPYLMTLDGDGFAVRLVIKCAECGHGLHHPKACTGCREGTLDRCRCERGKTWTT